MIRKKNKKTEFVYGIHSVQHALRQTPGEILELWILAGKRNSGDMAEFVNTAAAGGIAVQYVTRDALDKISGSAVHQGVAIRRRVAAPVTADLASLLDGLTGTAPFLLVLDGIQDPHNLGACLRTANAAGVHAVIIPKDRAVPVTATVRKIASGAAEHTPVISVTNLARTLELIRQRGIWCFGLAEQAEESLYAVDLNLPLALVLGAEGRGLRHNTRQHCDRLIQVPMFGQVESLNVSVAAAVCLYEVVRQRSVRSKE